MILVDETAPNERTSVIFELARATMADWIARWTASTHNIAWLRKMVCEKLETKKVSTSTPAQAARYIVRINYGLEACQVLILAM